MDVRVLESRITHALQGFTNAGALPQWAHKPRAQSFLVGGLKRSERNGFSIADVEHEAEAGAGAEAEVKAAK